MLYHLTSTPVLSVNNKTVINAKIGKNSCSNLSLTELPRSVYSHPCLRLFYYFCRRLDNLTCKGHNHVSASVYASENCAVLNTSLSLDGKLMTSSLVQLAIKSLKISVMYAMRTQRLFLFFFKSTKQLVSVSFIWGYHAANGRQSFGCLYAPLEGRIFQSGITLVVSVCSS